MDHPDETYQPPAQYTLLSTDDARVWAEEFCRIFNGKVVTTEESEGCDPGLMVGWFANAIETAKLLLMKHSQVEARTGDDGKVVLVTDPLPDQVLVSTPLLQQLIDRHNEVGGPRVGVPGPHRRFVLDRHEDITGISGTGVIAEGIEFSNGVVALQWVGKWPSSVVFYQGGMEGVRTVHGHGGSTEIRFID